jgi:hypothetical protein
MGSSGGGGRSASASYGDALVGAGDRHETEKAREAAESVSAPLQTQAGANRGLKRRGGWVRSRLARPTPAPAVALPGFRGVSDGLRR